MTLRRNRLRFVVGLGLFLCVSELSAQVKLTDPGFAAHERLIYRESLGVSARSYSIEWTRGDGATPAELRLHGADIDSLYHVDPVSLISLESESTLTAPDATIKRKTEYRDLHPTLGANDLMITDMGCLPFTLRGLPFASVHRTRIVYVGNTNLGGSNIGFELEVTGQQTITVNGKDWLCWHLTTGLSGALSLFLPKTEWWFAVGGSHPLIRSLGPAGGPGSPTRTLELAQQLP